MRNAVLALVFLLGCGTSSSAPDNLASSGINLSGRWASEIALDGSDGSTVVLYAVWAANEPTTPRHNGSFEVDDAWQLCSLTLPGPLTVPFDDDGLAQLVFAGPSGTMAGSYDGARFTQPPVPMVGGATLKSSSDSLPRTGAMLCGTSFTKDCISANPISGTAGVRALASGLSPDADQVDVDFKLILAFDATVNLAASTLDGAVTTVSLDSHVLGCHLRSGATCSASDAITLEAARPKVSYHGGTIRSHYQGTYFACPQLLADPEGSLSGREDGGAVSDGGSDGASDGGVGTASFSLIQSDVDFMGCASGGCHESRTAPGQMHLYFQPPTDFERRANYQAILPWTASGRFVNEVPLPSAIFARWTDWVDNGTPY